MPTTMKVVLLGGFRSLKPVTSIAIIGCRADVVACFGFMPCWEWRVFKAFMIDGSSLDCL